MAWIGHGEDHRWNARAAVPAALASIAPDDSETIAHLAQYIGDSNPCVGVACIRALGEAGPVAHGVLPTLLTLVAGALAYEDNDWRAIWMRDCPFLVGEAATRAVARIGADSDEAIQCLIVALTSRDAAIRRAAVEGLGEIGPRAEAAIFPLIQHGLGDDTDGNRPPAVAKALGRIGAPAVPALVATLESSRPELRRDALYALGMIGDDAPRDALIAVTELAGDSDAGVREAVAWVLYMSVRGSTRPLPDSAMARLIDLLGDTDESTRHLAAMTLGRLGPEAKSTLPALTKALRDGQESSPTPFIEALASIVTDEPEPVRALARALTDRDPSARRRAAVALWRIGPPASIEAIPLHQGCHVRGVGMLMPEVFTVQAPGSHMDFSSEIEAEVRHCDAI